MSGHANNDRALRGTEGSNQGCVIQPILPPPSNVRGTSRLQPSPNIGRNTMPDLMTWSKIVDNFVREGNLRMAAIFDLDGKKLACSEGISISQQEILGLLKSLKTPCTSLYGLFLGGCKVSCMRVDNRTLVGRTTDDVFAAYQTDNVLICGYTALGDDSSCLGSIKDFALKLNMQPVPGAVAAPSLI